MKTLRFINYIISIIFIVCYCYQFVYIPIKWFKRKKKDDEKYEFKRYAILICARNEEKVIGNLIDSINNQTYPKDKIKVFVMADNCDDDTELIAKGKGAITYSRKSLVNVGKGYALDCLLRNINRDYPDEFDGYFIFDADNILKGNYIEEMNKVFSIGNDIVTSYRNSKNYGSNWISAGYGLWFLRESQYLNGARYLLGNSCAVSGTGFLVSDAVIKKQDFWPFHMLTEDIEFSIHHITNGEKIAYCENAMLFDEQPTKFSQSITQRMRWAKGYLQVIKGYGKQLFIGILKGSFSCFDMTMNIMPAFVLSFISVILNIGLSIYTAINGEDIMIALISIGELFFNMYMTLFIIGMITTISEWRKIYTDSYKKILYMFTFPLFMFTYIPISIVALFVKVYWKPIEHNESVSIDDMELNNNETQV